MFIDFRFSGFRISEPLLAFFALNIPLILIDFRYSGFRNSEPLLAFCTVNIPLMFIDFRFSGFRNSEPLLVFLVVIKYSNLVWNALITYMYREGYFKNVIKILLNFLYLVLPRTLGLDKGTETGLMATMHSFLRDQLVDLENATKSIVYGPSTQNKMERWWRELLKRMERFLRSN